MSKISILAAVAASFSLSACMSGGSDEPATPFDTFVSNATPILNAPLAAVSELPNSANMKGAIGVDIAGANHSIVGEATATADFAGGTITGSADNLAFYDANDGCFDNLNTCVGTHVQDVNGSLNLNGAITGNTFTYNVAGTLSEDGSNTTAAIDMDGTGAFGKVDNKLVAAGLSDGTALLSSNGPGVSLAAEGVLLLTE